MTAVIQPFHLLVIALAGWLNRQQQVVIDYLIEENRVLKEQLGDNDFGSPTNNGCDWPLRPNCWGAGHLMSWRPL